ncbi:MAG: ABC transporter permease subunit [Phycisphaerales bacterium]
MAVYKQTYKDYEGPRTAGWSRFLILMRYSYARVFQSRFLVLFLALCTFYPIACAALIYLSHNSPALAMLKLQSNALPPIDGQFFYVFSVVQGVLALLLTAFIGPSLVSPDLANGGLALYLSRPFSRAEYVAGKMAVLLALLSAVTWIPGLLLYGIQASCTGWTWVKPNLWLAGSIVLGPLIWIVVLSLIALALSAWVKWRIAAGACVLGLHFVGAGFAQAINEILRTRKGSLINLGEVIHTVWGSLFDASRGADLSVTQAWIVLGVTCALCLILLARRIRGFEVVK